MNDPLQLLQVMESRTMDGGWSLPTTVLSTVVGEMVGVVDEKTELVNQHVDHDQNGGKREVSRVLQYLEGK